MLEVEQHRSPSQSSAKAAINEQMDGVHRKKKFKRTNPVEEIRPPDILAALIL